MGDSLGDNQSQFNNAFHKAFHNNRLNQETIPVPPTAATGDGSLANTPSPASNGNGDGSLPSAAAPAAQANQEDPQRILNNRGSAYNPPQQFAVAQDDDEVHRANRALWAQSNGAPAFYSQNVDFNRATIAGKFDRNVPLGGNPIYGVNLSPYDGGGTSNTYQRIEQASTVNPPSHLIMNVSAGAPAAVLGAIHPTRVLTGEAVCNAGIGSRIGSGFTKFLQVSMISEAFNWIEHFGREAHKDITLPIVNKTINTSDACHATETERLGEGALAWFALIKTPKIPAWIKWPVLGIVWTGCRIHDALTKHDSEQLDALNKAKNDLKADYVNRTAGSMSNAIDSYIKFGIRPYTTDGDPTHTVHEENNISNLKAIVEGWNGAAGDLYQPDQQLEKLRGSIIVNTALADTLMRKPVVIDPERNSARPHDYLDFGCAALKSLFNAKIDLQKCADLTQRGNGQVSDGTTVNAEKEVADLRAVEKQEIDHRINLIQFGQPDQSGKINGHDIASAFNELADKDAKDSQLESIVSGKDTSLVATMQQEALANKNTNNPYTQIITSKQFRDLALWQLANLDGNGTANIGPFGTPEQAQAAVNLYHFALFDFLYNANNLCPNVADNANQASGSTNFQQLNPDIANIDYIARVLAGKERARAGDDQLQKTADKVAASGIQAKLAVEYDGYVAHLSGADKASVESGGIQPARPGEPTGNLIPHGDDRQTRLKQTREEYEQQKADDAQQQKVDQQFRDQAKASQAAQANAAEQQAAASRQNYAEQQSAGQYSGGQYPAGAGSEY